MKKHIFNDNKLVIASHNEGKVEEIKIMLKPLQIEVLSANDFNLKEPIEDGNTFEKNALIKSSYVCKKTGIPSLSDDSGICFCDLNNEPGIYSARWAGKEKNFNLAMSKINDSISDLENFAILSPVSDNLEYPNYKIDKKISGAFSKDTIVNVGEIDGYSMVINKSFFTNNNFFDEKFFMYLENVDLCLRAKKNGGKLIIVKNSKIHHLGAKAVDDRYSKEVELSRNWHWMWSKIYFNKKHKGILISFVFGIISLTGNLFKYLVYLLTFNKKKKYL